LIPLIPSIIYTFNVPLTNGGLSFFGMLVWHTNQSATSPSLFEDISETLLVSLPVALGANAFCTAPNSPFTGDINFQNTTCTVVHGAWGIGFLLLFICACLLATRGGWKQWKRSHFQDVCLEE